MISRIMQIHIEMGEGKEKLQTKKINLLKSTNKGKIYRNDHFNKFFSFLPLRGYQCQHYLHTDETENRVTHCYHFFCHYYHRPNNRHPPDAPMDKEMGLCLFGCKSEEGTPLNWWCWLIAGVLDVDPVNVIAQHTRYWRELPILSTTK